MPPRSVRPVDLGGYDFAADPNLPATVAPVFWDTPSSSVIAATALPSALQGPPNSNIAWPPPRAERTAADERHVLLEDAITTQIVLLGTGNLAEPIAFLIPAAADLPKRVEQLLAFWRELTASHPSQSSITPQRRRRLILGLRALDGRAAGASYRTLAAGLFGPERVPVGPAWKSHDLRSRTLRLVSDATAIMRGEYRALAGLPQPNA